MIKTFSKKVRELMYNAYGGKCSMNGCYEPIHSFHHYLANTKANQKNFPLLLQSTFNCRPLCENCHKNNPPRMNLMVAATHEKWLREFMGVCI